MADVRLSAWRLNIVFKLLMFYFSVIRKEYI